VQTSLFARTPAAWQLTWTTETEVSVFTSAIAQPRRPRLPQWNHYVGISQRHFFPQEDGGIVMITCAVGPDGLRDCFRDPIPEIFEAAGLLNSAARAHLNGDRKSAETYLRAADMPVIGEWLDTIWSGHNNEFRAIRTVRDLPPVLPKEERCRPRDATPAMKKALIARDGFHCRLCGIPLIRPEVRKKINQLYPDAARWTGSRASDQHRGLQVMWLQYDHVVVHSRGGPTSMENIVVTCPACNFGRDRYMMSEVGLRDPRIHPRQPSWVNWSEWDGLERILPAQLRIEPQGCSRVC
jgi:5-methylcytosine-specific restriction endonuclease McrA